LRPVALLSGLRALCLVAIATSTALLFDYLTYSSAFCSPGSGCAAVQASAFEFLHGRPELVPVIGMAGFAALYVVSLMQKRRSLLGPLAYAAGAAALGLIVLQAGVIGDFCKLCMIVDVSALGIAVLAFLFRRASGGKPVVDPLRPGAYVALAVIALAAPLAWPWLKMDAPVPGAIKQFYQPGKINVVEFADFECPFCRMLHPTLQKLIHEYGERVNFVQLNMPLERHEHALDAAKGAVCADEQGKKALMAEQLFDSKDLSPRAIRRIAVKLGLDPLKFDECVLSKATQERIGRESKILRDAGFQGLPSTYIGGRLLVGALGEDVFREAFEQAARGEGNRGVPGWLYLVLALVAAGGVVVLGRARPAPAKPATPAPTAPGP
jgi:predicted DsbA family dithiol-disulfide isomerase/uncharacterized membrane protein